MALAGTLLGVSSGTTGPRTITFSKTPAAHSPLVASITLSTETATVSGVTPGWTAGPGSPVGGGDTLRVVTYYKISDGTETSFEFSNDLGTHQALVSCVEGFFNPTTLADSDQDDTDLDTASNKSQGSGSANASNTPACAIAAFGTDRWDTWETGLAFDSSFAELGKVTASGSRPGAFQAWRELPSAGTYSTNASTSDTGDESWGCILTFEEPGGGGGGPSIPVMVHHLRQQGIAG